jgi:hypothetical protein
MAYVDYRNQIAAHDRAKNRLAAERLSPRARHIWTTVFDPRLPSTGLSVAKSLERERAVFAGLEPDLRAEIISVLRVEVPQSAVRYVLPMQAKNRAVPTDFPPVQVKNMVVHTDF